MRTVLAFGDGRVAEACATAGALGRALGNLGLALRAGKKESGATFRASEIAWLECRTAIWTAFTSAAGTGYGLDLHREAAMRAFLIFDLSS